LFGRTARRFSALFETLPDIPYVPEKDRYVIFSDLHLGTPQFDINRQIYLQALDHYRRHDFTLILLGDIEELHRYSAPLLTEKYKQDAYDGERTFLQMDRHVRIFGNHDVDWRHSERVSTFLQPILPEVKIREGFKLCWGDRVLFMVHGHQGSLIHDALGPLGRFFLRYIAQPLGVYAMVSPAQNHQRRRRAERRYYDWAKRRGVLLITGHTHRPLFASLSKIDQIKIRIETLVREYVAEADSRKRDEMARQIVCEREKFQRCLDGADTETECASLAQNELLIPCSFNSGSGIHPDGITAIELSEGEIRLVFLYDAQRPGNEGKHRRAPTFFLSDHNEGSDPYRRQLLQAESLDYVFTRIRLLGGALRGKR
jgi:UDP-2,3-diacylglucosamine pyrophosphatase LpxH